MHDGLHYPFGYVCSQETEPTQLPAGFAFLPTASYWRPGSSLGMPIQDHLQMEVPQWPALCESCKVSMLGREAAKAKLWFAHKAGMKG